MSARFKFELVTPENLVVSKQVVMVTVPGSEGVFGVLAGHSPLIATIKAGVIDVYESNDNAISERIFIAGGFADVTNEGCTVLAEQAVPYAQLDRAALQTEIKSLEEELAACRVEEKRELISSQLELAKAKIQALS